MYRHQEERAVESICYDQVHIDKVVDVIKIRFSEYFNDFITLGAGSCVSEKKIQKIATNLGIEDIMGKKSLDFSTKLTDIITESLDNFEKDRAKYKDIFDKEKLEEYEDDPQSFKSTVLKNECPIIHSTLHNKRAKELDKYRYEFSISDPNDLLIVVKKLCCFSEEYYNNFYNKDSYDAIDNYKKLKFSELDTDDYTVYGVIGGGIKSQMLYKVYPSVFPNRSRGAMWALWYLADKESLDCKKNSEFLMIDVEKSITQQNYFYPYELFAFYAHQIFQMLKQKAEANNVYIDLEYRYVIVDAFMSFIAKQHEEEISLLKQQIKDGGYGYA